MWLFVSSVGYVTRMWKRLRKWLLTSHGHQLGLQALHTSKNQTVYSEYVHFKDIMKRLYVTVTKSIRWSLLGITAMQSNYCEKIACNWQKMSNDHFGITAMQCHYCEKGVCNSDKKCQMITFGITAMQSHHEKVVTVTKSVKWSLLGITAMQSHFETKVEQQMRCLLHRSMSL